MLPRHLLHSSTRVGFQTKKEEYTKTSKGIVIEGVVIVVSTSNPELCPESLRLSKKKWFKGTIKKFV